MALGISGADVFFQGLDVILIQSLWCPGFLVGLKVKSRAFIWLLGCCHGLVPKEDLLCFSLFTSHILCCQVPPPALDPELRQRSGDSGEQLPCLSILLITQRFLQTSLLILLLGRVETIYQASNSLRNLRQ